VSQTIVDRVLQQHESILMSDALSDARFRDRPSIERHGIRSLMCVPLWNNREVIGLIYVDRRRLPNLFSEEDLQVLTHLASVAAVKIDNARLVEEAASAKALESELRRAREIQTHLLPPGAPEIPGYLILGRSEPCQAVGGDHYDYLEKSRGRHAITIGDVAGKGLSAALLMCYFQASLKAVSDVDLSPEETIARLHALLSRRFPPDRFVTCFYGTLDPAEHTLNYVNAGHNPPLLLSRAGRLERLDATGRPLGMFTHDRHESRSVRIEPGDTLICYSDGVPDSRTPGGEWFGEERLVTLAQQAQDAPLNEVVEGVFNEVEKHRAGEIQEDDLTLVVLRRAL
jgi:serine phosphatase RsbU (regulator of sigma subunit)